MSHPITRAMAWIALCAGAGAGAAACTGHGDSYTLYGDSLMVPGIRVHVATFDASDDDGYNRENCDIARGLFQTQTGIKTKFWCEKGRFRK